MTTVKYVANDGSYWNSADLCKEYEVALSEEDFDERVFHDLIMADWNLDDNITLEEVR